MATVNLLNYGWGYSRSPDSSSQVVVNANSSSVQCYVPDNQSGFNAYVKIYIAITDISKYKTITLKFSSFYNSNEGSFQFGVFDDTSVASLSGESYELSSSNGTITINVSGSSGTKYVGFFMYGNANYPYIGEYGRPNFGVSITSLTAVEKGYTLTYDANGGSGAPSSVSNVTSTTISSTVPTRSGYDFLGWSKSSSATSATYVAGNSISLSANTTLYAVWKIKTYAVTYNANGGSGAPSSQTKTHGVALTLSTTKPTKSDTSAGSYTVTLNANGGTCSSASLSAARTTKYTFSKWNTNSSGTGTSYASGASYTTNAALALYAIYTSSITTAAVTLPTPTRGGYAFLGWATSVTASSGTVGSYTPSGNVTLYAIWGSSGLVYIHDNVGEYNPYIVLINDGSGWDQYIPYIYTESGWEIFSG